MSKKINLKKVFLLTNLTVLHVISTILKELHSSKKDKKQKPRSLSRKAALKLNQRNRSSPCSFLENACGVRVKCTKY